MKLIKLNNPEDEYRNLSGQTLVEALVALSVLSVSMLGVFVLLNNSIGLNRVISNRYVATYLASEGIELIKNKLDENSVQDPSHSSIPWNNGMSSASYEVDYQGNLQSVFGSLRYLTLSSDNLYGYGFGVATPFKRQVDLQFDSGGNRVKVDATVSWQERGGAYDQVQIEDYLYNWR